MERTDFLHIQALIKSDAGVKLLKMRSAALVIAFLYNQFRKKNLTTIPSDELEFSLALFLREHSEEEKVLEEEEIILDEATLESEGGTNALWQKTLNESDIQERASRYIELWLNDEHAYIRRYYNDKREAIIELAPATQRLFNYIENFEQKEFIGTESRFQTILLALRDLSSHVNEDPEVQIAELEKKQKKILEEIEEIKRTGKAQVYTNIEVQEKLDYIYKTARELMSDFQQIAENFSNILREVYKKQSETELSRGKILGYALDFDKELRTSAQGQSFYSFWDFISQDKNEEISGLVKNVLQTMEENDLQSVLTSDKIDFFDSLKQNLYGAGRKIIEQNRLLSNRLSGALHSQNSSSQKQITKLTSDIKNLMSTYAEQKRLGEASIKTASFMFLEAKANIAFPQSRKLVLPNTFSSFSKIEKADQGFDNEARSELLNQFCIDEKVLLKTIEDFRAQNNGNQFTLSQLVAAFPIQKGLSEILSYYAIATREDFATIQSEKVDKISFRGLDKKEKILSAPRIIFS